MFSFAASNRTGFIKTICFYKFSWNNWGGRSDRIGHSVSSATWTRTRTSIVTGAVTGAVTGVASGDGNVDGVNGCIIANGVNGGHYDLKIQI